MVRVIFKSIPEGAEIKRLYNVLRYVAATDTATERLSKISEELLPLGNFTTATTRSEFNTEIKKDRDLVFYFCHGLDGCLFDETDYCTIYPDSNLSDKILVLDACYSGITYSKEAVRSYGAIASLGYGAPLACQLSRDGFKEGFKECFLNVHKILLDAEEINKAVFIYAYHSTRDLYNSWGDKYAADGDAMCAQLFYANAKNLLYYTKWDVATTVDISISPLPAEIYHFGTYVGMAPLKAYGVMSGGNVFRYKAAGCYLTWLITNVPEAGEKYNLSPMQNHNKTVRKYADKSIYLEYNKEIVIPAPMPAATPEPFELVFYNYGDIEKENPMITNDRGWVHGFLSDKLYPHKMNGNHCLVHITESFEHRSEPYTEWIDFTVTLEEKNDTFSVPIRVMPSRGGSLAAESESLSAVIPPDILEQYYRASARERREKKYAIGNRLYSLEEIIEEIRNGTEVGLMFISTTQE